MLSRDDLREMELEDLMELQGKIKEEIERRKREDRKTFEYNFEATNDIKKRKNPYVARLYVRNGQVEREFKQLERSYGKYEVTVYGSYTAKVGDIIEKRVGSSWKNDYRSWYLIKEDGSEVKVADISSSTDKKLVMSYLKNEITMEELLKEVE